VLLFFTMSAPNGVEKAPVACDSETASQDVEKQGTATSIEIAAVDLDPAHAAEYQEYQRLHGHYQSDEKAQKRLIRLLDLRVIPMLFIFYLLNSLDKSNAGNVKIYTFLEDTNMTSHMFNLALTWYFFTYAGLEAPSK
jgi:hypothetical protein